MTPEERAVRLCPNYEGHARGNVDALGKCCDACEPIAVAIRAAVLEERKACAEDARNNRLGWHTEHDGFAKLKGDAIADAIEERPAP